MMTTSTPFPKRPKWPFIAGGVVLLLVAALVGGWLLGRGQAGEPDPDATTAPPATTEPSGEDGDGVEGCLGGPERTPEMVLSAQEQADVGSYADGVAFAAALMRWVVQAPPVPATEDQLDIITAPDADSSVREAIEDAATDGASSESARWVSVTGGKWYIETTSSDELVVSLSLLPVLDGELNADTRMLMTVSLSRADGAWAWSRFEAQIREADEMEEIGTPFTGGCG